MPSVARCSVQGQQLLPVASARWSERHVSTEIALTEPA